MVDNIDPLAALVKFTGMMIFRCPVRRRNMFGPPSTPSCLASIFTLSSILEEQDGNSEQDGKVKVAAGA